MSAQPLPNEKLFDPRLPPASCVYRTHFPVRHVLVRPYQREGFHIVPGMDPTLPLEKRSIFLSRNAKKYPPVWGWILAVHEVDFVIEPTLEPGAMVIFKRYGDAPIGHDMPKNPLWLGQRLDVHLVHVASLECTFNPPLVNPPSYV